MASPNLIIAGVPVSVIAALDLTQDMEREDGSSFSRMAAGQGFKITFWEKRRIRVSAQGWIPPALHGIDYRAPFVAEFSKPLALAIGEPIPDGITARSAPWGERTVIDQSGASVRLLFFKMTVFSSGPRVSGGRGLDTSWEIEFREF